MIVRNFLFHKISPVSDELWASIHPELFERIIKYSVLNYRIINLENLYLSDSVKQELKPFATISFDDGYKECISYAAGILKKYYCPATFYLVTGCIENNIPTWTFIIDYLFQNTNRLTFDFDKDNVPELLRKTAWKNKKERIDYLRKLKPYLKCIPDYKRESIMKSVVSHFNDVEIPKPMMNWNDVNTLINNGFTVGSHTESHRILINIEEDNLLKNELSNSANIIYEKTGKYPVSVSYPCGFYDDRVVKFSKDSGYKIGLTSGQRFYDTGKDNLFEIPRVELYNESWVKTRLRMNGGLEFIKSMVR